jgi:hypothetical protein
LLRTASMRSATANFFRQNMDGKYVRPVIPLADMPGMIAKNYQAVSCQAQNRSHLRISRALNKKVKFGGVPIKVIPQELLLRGHPVIQVKAMLAATPLKNLVGASGDCRLDNLLMPISAALDRNYPVVKNVRMNLSIRVTLCAFILDYSVKSC